MNTYLKKVEAIMRAIEPELKDGFMAELYARNLLAYATDDQTHFEVRASHTRTGAPFTITVGA